MFSEPNLEIHLIKKNDLKIETIESGLSPFFFIYII
jgi:hypothetical protein